MIGAKIPEQRDERMAVEAEAVAGLDRDPVRRGVRFERHDRFPGFWLGELGKQAGLTA